MKNLPCCFHALHMQWHLLELKFLRWQALMKTESLCSMSKPLMVHNGSVETTLPGEGLNAPTASIVGNKLYVMGGFKAVSNKPTDEVQVYDLQTHEWSMASPLPNPRGGHVAVVLDEKIHLFGGGQLRVVDACRSFGV